MILIATLFICRVFETYLYLTHQLTFSERKINHKIAITCVETIFYSHYFNIRILLKLLKYLLHFSDGT
jgi:hypothetical protein